MKTINSGFVLSLMMGLVVALAVFTGTAKADTRLYLGAITEHFSSVEYNETHELVMIEHEGFIAGYTPNSYDEDTFLLGGKFRIRKLDFIENVETSGLVVATYGYRSCSKGWSESDRDVCGMAALQLDYTKSNRYHPSLIITPVFVGITGAIVF